MVLVFGLSIPRCLIPCMVIPKSYANATIVSNNCSRKSASLFCFSNDDDDDAFDGSIGELQFSYVIITTNNSGYSITTFEVMMQILYWPIISVSTSSY